MAAKVKLVPIFKSVPQKDAYGKIVEGQDRKLRILVPENDVDTFLSDERFSKSESEKERTRPGKDSKSESEKE
jgi:hypothetical protein